MRYCIRKAKPKDLIKIYRILSSQRDRLGSWCTSRQAILKWIEKECIDCLWMNDVLAAVKIQNKLRIYSLASVLPGAGLTLLQSSLIHSYGLVSTRNKTAQAIHKKAGFKKLGRVKLHVAKKGKWFYIMQKEV